METLSSLSLSLLARRSSRGRAEAAAAPGRGSAVIVMRALKNQPAGHVALSLSLVLYNTVLYIYIYIGTHTLDCVRPSTGRLYTAAAAALLSRTIYRYIYIYMYQQHTRVFYFPPKYIMRVRSRSWRRDDADDSAALSSSGCSGESTPSYAPRPRPVAVQLVRELSARTESPRYVCA